VVALLGAGQAEIAENWALPPVSVARPNGFTIRVSFVTSSNVEKAVYLLTVIDGVHVSSRVAVVGYPEGCAMSNGGCHASLDGDFLEVASSIVSIELIPLSIAIGYEEVDVVIIVEVGSGDATAHPGLHPEPLNSNRLANCR